jgi:hypothetical protein
MDTKEVIARFEAERQALALMDHPNIARVLDAGATDTGRPFFVMELVRGVKITDYCDQHNLSTPERLRLFIQVCHAIQHAHQKGIIHRDIKPSNILVTIQDGEPVPKVIDFGIAKATQGRLTDRTLFTAFEQFIGTPAYMSPEQAQMSGVDIDTRSDIYSLGVLLYELLTGRPPFEGLRGSPESIDFTGNRTFSARAIGEGLASDDSFILAAYPEAPLDEFMEATRQSILRGYQGLGFPQAAVTVRDDPARARLVVTVAEGPRFMRGEIQVLGLGKVSEAEVIQALTDPAATGPDRLAEAVTAFWAKQAEIDKRANALRAILSATPSGLSATSAVGRPGAASPPELFTMPIHRPSRALWKTGAPASFAEDHLLDIVGTVRQLLDMKGYPLAEIRAQIEPDSTTGLARLLLHVTEGPTTSLGAIRVVGNARNTAEDIIRCSGLTIGMGLDASAIAKARVALWSSARFYDFTLSVRPSAHTSNSCEAEINVCESEAMPPLREALPRSQAALVRFANWVTMEARRRELDLSVSSADIPDFSIALNPEHGDAFYLGDPKSGTLLALLVRSDGVRLFGADGADITGIDVCRARVQPSIFIHMSTTRDPSRHGDFSAGLGATTDEGPDDWGAVSIVLSPIFACQYLGAMTVPSFEGGDVVLRMGEGESKMSLRFREDSGELLSVDRVQLGDTLVSLRVGGGDFARISARVDKGWARLPFDPVQRQSLAGMLLKCNSGKRPAADSRIQPGILLAAASLRIVERLLAMPEMRTWLDPVPIPEDRPFPIPADVQHPLASDETAGQLARALYQFGRIFNPPQSWPARLLREPPYLLLGQTGRSGAVLGDLANDQGMGPVGSLMAAKLLQKFNQPEAWRFARRAVEHGSVEEFRKDYLTLSDGDSTIARMIYAALPALASLTDAEVNQITADLPTAQAAVFRVSLAILRDMKTEGVVSALRLPLEIWWKQEMQPTLPERVSGFLSSGDPPDPSRIAAVVNGLPVRRRMLALVRHDFSLLAPVPIGVPTVTSSGLADSDPAMEALITLTLVLGEATNQGIDLSDEAIGRKVGETVRERFHGDQGAFAAMLSKEGMTRDEFVELTRLNSAYAGMSERIEREMDAPATGAVAAAQGDRLTTPESAAERPGSTAQKRRQAVVGWLQRLRDTSFVYRIPVPAVSRGN